MKTDLTENQRSALKAVADPFGLAGTLWWAEARSSWPGPRRTLGSLVDRGLVEHRPGADRRWILTDDGARGIEELERLEKIEERRRRERRSSA